MNIIGISIIYIGVALVSIYLVWNNRSSTTLVTNFFSVLTIGFLGILITALVTLKEVVIKGDFTAVLFYKSDSLTIPTINGKFKKDGIRPILFTNRVLLETQILEIVKGKKQNITSNLDESEDMLLRYIFDILSSRFASHWYLESFEIKAPSSYSGTYGPIDNTLPKKTITWEEIRKKFPSNNFLQIEGPLETVEKGFKLKINVPPNTTLNTKKITNGSNVEFENPYMVLSIDFIRFTNAGKNVNEKIIKTFNILPEHEALYIFKPFIVKYRITKKRFKSGHPDMEKYEHWAKDLIYSIEKNISEKEFWSIVDLNS